MSRVAQTIVHSCSGKEFGSIVFCKTSQNMSCTGSLYSEMRGNVTPASTAEEQHLEIFPQTFFLIENSGFGATTSEFVLLVPRKQLCDCCWVRH